MIKKVKQGLKRRIISFNKDYLIKANNYIPANLAISKPDNYLDVISAWKGLEQIIPDIIQRFSLNTNTMLEFGVDNGFSTAIFSNYFQDVTGVDYFEGDIHAGYRDVFKETSANLNKFKNIKLVKNSYQKFIKDNNNTYDLIHVDIIHTYDDTYACGLWAAKHSKCVIFHDTESFLEVRKAVRDVAKDTGKTFYNYKEHFGLGIVV